MTFYKGGRKSKLVIDDRIPTSRGQTFNTGVSDNGAWWMPILEKAYAKFNVNYANLNGGNPPEALRELSGMPTMAYVAD